ncbi:BatD family protein [Rheinheimera sp. F8]|uniref:BatD family protein n=1 Tax=Rheinheimera sp. F8 TaxID=1763998 RepID=UPI001AD81732|nr:BatD family protein [Rheinheimera sp. F8]
MVKLAGRLLLLTLCLISQVQAATQLKASVDKNPAMYGEAIMLQLVLDEKVDAGAIDFASLEADFRVTGPSVSQSMQIVNGQSSQSTSWQLSLFPRRTGTLTIPAFQIGALSSEPISLEVQPASQASGKGAELFLQNSFSSESVHVQQMLYYEIKIYFKGELQRGNLSQPELAGADVEQVGKDIENSEIVNGERYQTITRRYSVIPQKSGTLTLNPPFFNGEMIDRDNSRYDYFARTKAVSAEGQALSLQVKPIPDGQQQNWLASELVALTEEWNPAGDQLIQGEPVTRTITLTALDLADNQLPDLQLGTVAGAKIYPEQPQSRKAERKGRIVAQKVFSYAIIADKAGSLTLPEVRVRWWNTKTNQPDEAVLSAVTLQVAPNPQAVSQPEPAATTTTSADRVQPTQVSDWHFSYSSWLLLSLWLLTLAAWGLWAMAAPRTAERDNTKLPRTTAGSELRFNSRKLKQACQQHDAALAREQLLRWAQQLISANIESLTDLVQHLPDGALKTQIQQLSYQGYQPAGAQWQGQALLEAWAHFHHQPVTTAEGLAPLYPRG